MSTADHPRCVIHGYREGDYTMVRVTVEGESLILGGLLSVIVDNEPELAKIWRDTMVEVAKIALEAKGYRVGALIYDSTAAKTGASEH